MLYSKRNTFDKSILDRGWDYFTDSINYCKYQQLLVFLICTQVKFNNITINSSNRTIHHSYEKITVISELIVISRRPCQTAL